MRRWRVWSLGLMLGVAVMAPSRVASAQHRHQPAPPPAPAAAPSPAPEAQSMELKRKGDALFMQRDFVGALQAYEQAYALSPNPALLYNRGRALQSLARFPEALDALKQFSDQAGEELKAKVSGLSDLMAEIAAKVATVVISCNVAGGHVLLGGHEVGTTPLAQSIRIDAGKTTLEVLADGYFPYRKEVELAGGQKTDLAVTLLSRDTLGYLVVSSHVAGARVAVDDKAIGVAPAEVGLPPGAHPVVVSREGLNDAATQVFIRAGERRELVLDPIKGRPITAKWWFWTIVGAAVIGAASTVTYFALTTESGAPTGDFSPGKARF
ncbi:MAG TPA: PEGA domain-containing protein [Polyangiaceae bacterium]|nr:PEGA domain-containing protein [Polyangiaceae bacterium]